jgi:hypothetical protein
MSRPPGGGPDHQIYEAQERVAQQAALVRRSIVQGTLTQAAEDRLRQLEQALLRMKEQRGHTPASEIQSKVRDRRSRRASTE